MSTTMQAAGSANGGEESGESNATDGVAAQPARQGTFAALRFRNFRLFWWGQVVSVTGTFMQSTAQQWLVLTLSHSAIALGVTGALQFGPSLALGPFAGILIDRYPRRRLLVITQSSAAALALVLWLLTATGVVQLWHIYALALLLGFVNALDNPTRQAFVSELAPGSYLLNAISMNSAQFNVARVIGPAVAGLLISWLGIPLMFLLNALSFIAVIASLFAMRVEDFFAVPLRRGGGGLRALGEGMHFIWDKPDVRIIFLLIAVIGTLGFNFNVLLPLVAYQSLHAGPQEFGLLTSALGIGALTGALALARRGGRPTRRIVLTTGALFGVLLVIVGQMRWLPLALVGIALMGAMMSTFSASVNTTVQLSSPPEMRGRVMSVYSTIFLGSTPIGNLATSAVATAFGVPVAFAFTGVPCVAVVGIAAWLWRRERVKAATADTKTAAAADASLNAVAETHLGTNVLPEPSAPAADSSTLSTSGSHSLSPRLLPGAPEQPTVQARATDPE